MSSAARITVMTGPDEGRSFDVLQELAHIGRDEDAQIVLTDPTVARHQASIARRGGRFALFTPFDGGAHVDGAAVPADRWVWLPSMAEIQLGDDTRVRFETASNGTSADTGSETVADSGATRKPAAEVPTTKDGSSSTARRRRKKGEKRQVAKLSLDAAGTPLVQLGADGRLPEFHLSDTPITESEQSNDASVRPWLAVTAVAASALVSVFLMLWSPDTGAPSTQSARSARESLTEFYGKDGADLEPYQKLLRQAAIERSQGRFKEERRLYLRVLDLLNSWDASNARNLNGLTGKQTGRGKNSDRDLQKYLETLVAAP
jgi:pSer/pThr/pTyr-binding forkhead associated (FHA) protein